MSDAKPYTSEDVRAWVEMRWERERLDEKTMARIRATVEERDALQAQVLSLKADGEAARLAAAKTEAAEQAWDEAVKATELEQAHVRLRAVAAAREEQREADARWLEIDYSHMSGMHAEALEAAKCVRATPLTPTPLGDENKALRARVAELEVMGAAAAGIAREFDRRNEESKARVAELERERDALKAQVEAVRELCLAVTHNGATKAAWEVAHRVLAAMDEVRGGNRGGSEGAVDVAERLIRERDEAVEALRYVRALLPHGLPGSMYAVGRDLANGVLAKYPKAEP